jgi:hypothetical protein
LILPYLGDEGCGKGINERELRHKGVNKQERKEMKK